MVDEPSKPDESTEVLWSTLCGDRRNTDYIKALILFISDDVISIFPMEEVCDQYGYHPQYKLAPVKVKVDGEYGHGSCQQKTGSPYYHSMWRPIDTNGQ